MSSNILREISTEAAQYSPVFIVGSPRSGSSVLYRTLQKMNSFRCKRENLTESSILSFCQKSFNIRRDKPPQLLGYMDHDSEIYDQFLDSLTSIKLRQNIFHVLAKLGIKNDSVFWWQLGNNHLVVRSFFYFAKKARQCERILEKTPSNIENSLKLLAAFPKCKQLYIYRHPVDVFTSYRKRNKIEGSSWSNITVQSFCETYEKSIRLAMKLASQYPTQIIMIRYEEFVQNPEKEIKNLCNFISEEFDQKVITEENPDLSKWAIDPHLFGDIVSKTKRWQDFVSNEETADLENRLQSLMEKLKYPKYSDPISK